MHKPLFFIGLFLMVQNGLFGQCLALPLCPGVTQIVCDTTENNSNYWSNFYNSPVYSDGLGEVPTELSMQIIDSCTADSLQVSFVLLLDLNADGIRETSVSSDALYSAGLVNYNNVIYPDYTGSQLTAFDSRLVPANEKYKFTIEKIVQDSLVTVRMRWANAMHPNNYVLPELPNGAHRVEWRFEKNGQIRTCGYNFVIKD
ncbi:MAG: hypothetical protein LH618_02425, partial [Saprospiraceae bacterium]|nr:hypothetical protein [Saprospiraceae bacterium]